MFPEELPEFLILMNKDASVYEFITNPVSNYCLSREKHLQCARYKIKEDGKQPTPGLSPDGKNINIMNSITKQKIVAEEFNHTKPC
jgi:hypothetical protein